MRVLIAAGIYPPDIGGPATYASLLAQHLHHNGDEVSVVSYGVATGVAHESGITVVRVSRKLSKPVAYFLYLIKLICTAKKVDGIYAQGPLVGGVHGVIVSWLLRKPLIVKVTGDYAWEQAAANHLTEDTIDEFQNAKSVPLKISIIRRLQRFSVQHAKVVITPSNYLATMVMGWAPQVTPHVIHNGVEVISGAARHKVEFRNKRVISVGRMVPWKGFDTLIKIWPNVVKEVPGAELLIVGDGPDRDKLKELVSTSEAKDLITLAGGTSRSELFELFSSSAAFVLNSSYEGLSHTLIEALHHGVPSVVSSSGGNPEVISHGKNGLLFSYNDSGEIQKSIIRLLTNKEEAHTFATLGIETAQKFSKSRMLAESRSFLKDEFSTND